MDYIIKNDEMNLYPETKKLIRFGKSSDALLKLKSSFFDDNDSLLKLSQGVASIYSQQPRRKNCKCCNQIITDISFTKQGIDYLICARCGHLNGAYEDTIEFCDALYTKASGAAYATNYFSVDQAVFNQRVKDVYVPKAEFLLSALTELGYSSQKVSVADFGAGSGYFVAALLESGFEDVAGFEVSETQVALANRMIKQPLVRHHSLADTVLLAKQTKANVVSLIGVLEHLQNPREMMAAITSNPNIKFLYLSVPLFSPCVFFEMIFPQVMQRHLSAGHTHLFTESSLDWIFQEFGIKRRAEWWFGTDMVDLYRSMKVQLNKTKETKKMAEMWSKLWVPIIDILQLQMDKQHLSSEVHMLLSVDKLSPQ